MTACPVHSLPTPDYDTRHLEGPDPEPSEDELIAELVDHLLGHPTGQGDPAYCADCYYAHEIRTLDLGIEDVNLYDDYQDRCEDEACECRSRNPYPRCGHEEPNEHPRCDRCWWDQTHEADGTPARDVEVS